MSEWFTYSSPPTGGGGRERALETKVAAHVQNLFHTSGNEQLVYHNLEHTTHVVERAAEIMDFSKLTDEDRLVVLIAAWFHDTGHLFSPISNHETVSAEVMRDFLLIHKCEHAFIKNIADCILATRFPPNPVTIMEQILCDADTYHLGTDDFFATNEKVRQELFLREGIKIEDWDRYSINFLKVHRFFTAYCQEKLNPGKESNIKTLENRLSKAH